MSTSSTLRQGDAWLPDGGDQGRGPIGILAAMPQEIHGLVDRLADGATSSSSDRTGRDGIHASGLARSTQRWGQRDFHTGVLHGEDCVIALSRIGKVAAAASAATLIHRFNVRAIVFTGVAGGVSPDVRVGDVVVADSLMQHDLDARPIFPRFEVPLLDRHRFDTDIGLTHRLAQAVARFLDAHERHVDGGLPVKPRLHRGLIGSGDRFVSDSGELRALLDAIPDLLAVDMESAAVAQVCYEHDVPVAVVRSISDGADEHAAMSFARFLEEVAGRYADGILERFLRTDE